MCWVSLVFSFLICVGLPSLGGAYVVGGVGMFFVLGEKYSLGWYCILFEECVLGFCGYMDG